MTELLVLVFVFSLIYLYHTMKKPTGPTEKPTTKAKAEKPVAVVATEANTGNISPTKKPLSKQKTITPKPMPMEKTEQPIVEASIQTRPKKPNPAQKSPGKAKDIAPITEASMTGMATPERVGLTAGDIWRYLDKNGATAVAQLARELPEEEKTIQRSIGWLAQEGKITLDTIDRVETISLAG
jgi:Winged helix-turn-helix domain (DUF2582)